MNLAIRDPSIPTPGQPDPFLSMPRDLLSTIALFLSIEDMGRLSRVSKLWQSCLQNDDLWRAIAKKYDIKVKKYIIKVRSTPYQDVKAKFLKNQESLHGHVKKIIGREAFSQLPMASVEGIAAPLAQGTNNSGANYILLRYVNRESLGLMSPGK